MKTVAETLSGSNAISLSTLNTNFNTNQDMGGLVNDILANGDTFEAKQAFLLLRSHLSEDELSRFEKRSEYKFIVEVGKGMLEDLVKKAAIEVVWAFNESGKLPEGKDEEFAKATCLAVFKDEEFYYDKVSSNARDESALLFQSLNSTQELFANMVAAKASAQDVAIPEKRVTTLQEIIENFIKAISELVFGKEEVKEAPVAEKTIAPEETLAQEAERWGAKVTGRPDSTIERQ